MQYPYKIKKFISKTLVSGAVLILMSHSVMATEDEPSAWARETIDQVLFDGTALQGFLIDYQGPVSKEQYLELLVKIYEGVTDETIVIPGDLQPFYDDTNEHVLKAKAMGWANGNEENILDSYHSMTREEAITLLIRMMGSFESYYGIDMPITQNQETFLDQDKISQWAFEAVQQARSIGIVKGNTDNQFNPTDLVTSEEMLIITHRMVLLLEQEGLTTDGWRIRFLDYMEIDRDENGHILEMSLSTTVDDVADSNETTSIVDHDTEQEDSQEGYVVADILNVRSTPDLTRSSNIIGKIKGGTSVTIISTLGEWYEISAEGITGYVHSDYVRFKISGEGSMALRRELIAYGLNYVGTPYKYAGASLTKGVDCSHFTMLVYREFGYTLSPGSRTQATEGIPITEAELLPGDIVVYGYGTRVNHVALYIGNGEILHATTSYGVKVTAMRGFLSQNIIGFRRVIQ